MSIGRWPLEIKYLLEYLAIWPVFALGRRLSEAHGRKLAIGLSRVAYWILPFNRRWCLRNLELVFGSNLSPAQRKVLAKKVFENILVTCLESLRWTPEWMAKQVIVEGFEEGLTAAHEATRRGTGVLVISAHLGNFELIPAVIHNAGWKGVVTYRPVNNWRVERLLAARRTTYMRQTIPRGPLSLMPLLWNLREGQGVGLLVDVNTVSKPVFVDFLGFPAASPPGAALLALATRCPVILAVSIRQPDGRHRLVFHPPFELIDTGDRQRDIAANTLQYMKAIEPYVLAYPEQYHWTQPRWRYRPDGSSWNADMPFEKMAAERIGPELRPVQDKSADTSGVRAA